MNTNAPIEIVDLIQIYLKKGNDIKNRAKLQIAAEIGDGNTYNVYNLNLATRIHDREPSFISVDNLDVNLHNSKGYWITFTEIEFEDIITILKSFN